MTGVQTCALPIFKVFIPIDVGVSIYLKWTTYIDDGRVGSASYANDTLRGQTHGIEIYKGQPKYISYGPNGQIYYTYNPINGTYYRVENN